MTVLIVGLVIFLGAHSVRIFADGWRSAQIDRIGLNAWKGLYSAASLVGFILIVVGFGMARAEPIILWSPPSALRHLAGLLLLPAFVLFVAAYVPSTRIKARLGHPMVVGVKLWAFAHLIANGMLAGTILFGSLLVWAVLDFASARRRDKAAGMVYPVGDLRGDLTAVAIGLVAWAAFAFWLHGWLIGLRPFG